MRPQLYYLLHTIQLFQFFHEPYWILNLSSYHIWCNNSVVSDAYPTRVRTSQPFHTFAWIPTTTPNILETQNPSDLVKKRCGITLSIYAINQDNFRQPEKKPGATYTSIKNPHFSGSPKFSIAKTQLKKLYHTSLLSDSANLPPYKAH